MAFSSHIFVFYFLPLFLLLYYLLPSKSNLPRNVLLLVAGYAFYAWASPWFVVVLVGSTVVTYVLSKLAVSAANRNVQTALLVMAIAANLSVLGVFKYYSFVQSNLNCLLKIAGDSAGLPVLAFALPVGLSFYSFKAISYSVDVYRSNSPPARSLLDFALYTSFFPQVLSGPIQRFDTIGAKSQPVPTFAEQVRSRRCTLNKFAQGSALFIAGFAKKVLLADTLARLADAVFTAESPGASDAWFGAVAYSFQLYFDFSGYSEMAVGLGLVLGFECPRNFNAPYLAQSITDFWRRWHISLSSWFRDYLYIPLGGNRKNAARTYLNLAAVFLLCGLWHGANWTFIVWGAFHGLLLIIERAFGKRTIYSALPRPIRVFLTFVMLTVGWVFFRSANLGDACRLLGTMFGGSAAQGGSVLLAGEIYTRGSLIAVAVCALLVFQPIQAFDWSRRLTYLKVLILIALFCLSLMVMFTKSFNSFLYFQF